MRLMASRLFLFLFVVHSVYATAQQTAAPSSVTAIPRMLSLFEAEQLLMSRSLPLSAGRSQLQASQAARWIAGYKPNPQLQLGMEQIPFQSNVPGSVPRFFATNGDAGANPTYTAQFSKLFERGGKRELRIHQADAQVNAVSAQVQDVLRNQLFALRQAFGNAVLARDNLRLAVEIDTQYGKTEGLTLERVKAGDLPGIELYRLQAGRLQFKQAVIDAQNSYEQATRDLLNVLSARAQDIVATNTRSVALREDTADPFQSASLLVVGDFIDVPVLQTADQIRELAYAERPDLKIAQANLEAADYGVRLAQAQRSRDLTVATEYQRIGNDDSVGILTQIPLLLYNNGKAGVEQAVALRAATEAQLRQSEIQVNTDVEKAYQAYISARRSVALFSNENLQQVRKVRDIVEFSYQHGAATLLELLDAERTVRQAATSYNQARANYQLSLWQLDQAVGRDLQ